MTGVTRRALTQVRVAVTGGELEVGVWDAAGNHNVLAIHGITANHRSFALLAERLTDVRLVAPDLRGRGRSNALAGPFGLHSHVDDMIAVLDAQGIERVSVIAHSMGAFVAVLLAATHPERVSRLILVDGGVPLALPSGLSAETVDSRVLGPAAARLSMTFRDAVAYREFWRAHPSFGPYWNSAIEDYVNYDLEGMEPELRPASNRAAVEVDVTQLYGGEEYAAAIASVRCPIVFFRAPRGLLDEPGGLYPERAAIAAALTHADIRDVDDTNHYTVLLGHRGADAIAGAFFAAGQTVRLREANTAPVTAAGRSPARQGGHR